jgi:hypothetical protein
MYKIRNRPDNVNHNDPNWAKHRRNAEARRKAGRKASKLKWKLASKYEAKRVWRTYAMTIDDIYAMHKAQDGRCANVGCREIIQALGRGRAVDHDHKTGKVRGMLCKACNLGLGLFNDSPRRLVGILAYLGYIDAKLLK